MSHLITQALSRLTGTKTRVGNACDSLVAERKHTRYDPYMNRGQPRITIVTPTSNRVEFLEECIVSVLEQKYPNLEYIICDGGSLNKEPFNVIKKYEAQIAWWDSMPDRGHAEAIRRGFDQSLVR